MRKKVIVIGAGVAGLSAGIYAQRSGFDVTIIEQHTIPGGMCTSWRRKGYLFEGAIHWLTGSNPLTNLYQVWQETGALSEHIKIFYQEPFASVEWEGKTVCLYRDLEKTRKHFMAVSPEDTEAINQYVEDVQAFAQVQMPVTDIEGVKAKNPKIMTQDTMPKMASVMPIIEKAAQMSCGEYASQFKHPALRLLMNHLPSNYSATFFLFMMGTLAADDGGYPEGGSLPMTRRMADTFTALGGKLILGTKVKKIMVADGAVVGVTLENGTLRAEAIIITQETIAAVEQLFTPPPADEWLQTLRKDTKPAVCTFAGVGVRAEVPQTPSFILPQPIVCGGISYDVMHLNNYAGFKGYAPAGGTALTLFFLNDTYDFWKKAKQDGRYEVEKQRLAEQIRRALCLKYPHVEGKIEVIDIATPLTYERYTGAYRGSWMGVREKGDKQPSCPGFLADIKGAYFAGQRTISTGGLPPALISGRNAAQMVCRQFDTVFINA